MHSKPLELGIPVLTERFSGQSGVGVVIGDVGWKTSLRGTGLVGVRTGSTAAVCCGIE